MLIISCPAQESLTDAAERVLDRRSFTVSQYWPTSRRRRL